LTTFFTKIFLKLKYRWAAKEATFKALGRTKPRLLFTDISVSSSRDGKLDLRFHGDAEQVTRSKHIKATHVSISHESEYAVAQVVIEGDSE